MCGSVDDTHCTFASDFFKIFIFPLGHRVEGWGGGRLCPHIPTRAPNFQTFRHPCLIITRWKLWKISNSCKIHNSELNSFPIVVQISIQIYAIRQSISGNLIQCVARARHRLAWRHQLSYREWRHSRGHWCATTKGLSRAPEKARAPKLSPSASTAAALYDSSKTQSPEPEKLARTQYGPIRSCGLESDCLFLSRTT